MTTPLASLLRLEFLSLVRQKRVWVLLTINAILFSSSVVLHATSDDPLMLKETTLDLITLSLILAGLWPWGNISPKGQPASEIPFAQTYWFSRPASRSHVLTARLGVRLSIGVLLIIVVSAASMALRPKSARAAMVGIKGFDVIKRFEEAGYQPVFLDKAGEAEYRSGAPANGGKPTFALKAAIAGLPSPQWLALALALAYQVVAQFAAGIMVSVQSGVSRSRRWGVYLIAGVIVLLPSLTMMLESSKFDVAIYLHPLACALGFATLLLVEVAWMLAMWRSVDV